LWSLLYDSAARSAEILDLPNHRARVTKKGGRDDVVIWKSRTARLLSNYLEGSRDGPVFLTERGARSNCNLGPGDRNRKGKARLSYERTETQFHTWTETLFDEAATLHQPRHSALTHDARTGCRRRC
jgi:integrase/recombinase XerC/integrase/recombinase XerD